VKITGCEVHHYAIFSMIHLPPSLLHVVVSYNSNVDEQDLTIALDQKLFTVLNLAVGCHDRARL